MMDASPDLEVSWSSAGGHLLQEQSKMSSISNIQSAFFSLSAAASKLKLLQSDGWLDGHTVSLHFTLFSPAPHLFTSVNLHTEQSPPAGLLPSARVQSVGGCHSPAVGEYGVMVCQRAFRCDWVAGPRKWSENGQIHVFLLLWRDAEVRQDQMDGMECGDVEWKKNFRPEPLCEGRRPRSKPVSLRMSMQSGGRWLFREWRSEPEKSGGMIGGCGASTELAVAGDQGSDGCGRRSGVSQGYKPQNTPQHHRRTMSAICRGEVGRSGCRATSPLAC
ncbi:hypothetical protein KUCAC02_032192 [Chaenocephalus aceratus]|nr:hypothetical protein KUCAC02_032192 [Chaenocephalus aceratus]